MNDTDERTSYRRSGAVSSGRFSSGTLVTLLVAVVMALLLFVGFEAGWYYSIATPVVTALPVLLAAYWAVALGHCRNAQAAGVLSFVAGAVVILGYFHFHLVSLVGPQAVHRLDLLPRFVAHRMANDAVEEDGQVRPPDPIRNWLFLVVDSFIVCTIIAAPTVPRANRAYCETCGRWMRQLSTAGPPGSGRLIGNALEMEDLAALPAVATHKLSLKDPCSMIKLEYCPNSRERATPCRAFLTVTENLGGGLENARTQQLLKQMEVKPDEVLLLADRVVALRPLLISAPDLQPTGQSGQPATPLTVRSGEVAQIQRLPEEAWGPSGKATEAREISLSFTPVVSFLGGVGLLVW